MKYVLLLAEDENANAVPTEGPAFEAFMAPWAEYTRKLQEAGAMVGGAPLEPTTHAKSLRVRNGERTVEDGPYADSKEQLGGFYMIEAGSMEEALNWAAECPAAKTGTVEVRPVPQWG